jgi:Nif-specific regulatory protein
VTDLIARVAAILDRNPPDGAVAELRRLVAAHAGPPGSDGRPACAGHGEPRCVVGSHPAMQEAARAVRRAAPTDLPVLILGESGTGKGLFAEMVHRHSGRRGPFLKVNCAALPEALIESELFGHERGAFTGAAAERKGRFELAAGGTLFLDEIGETTPAFQVKLLRVLQDGEFERVGGVRTLRADVRIVAATNRDLAAMVADGRFRTDLFYRLSVIPVTLPPLRERRQDIADLARRILGDFDRRRALDPEALDLLRSCDFPGNIRELENCLKRASVMADGAVLKAADFGCRKGQCAAARRAMPQLAPPAERPPASNPGLKVDRDRLVEALTAAGWSQAKAGRLIGLTTRQVAYAVRKYDIALPRW